MAALENPKSPEFKAAVATEDALWSHALQQIPAPRLRAWTKSMDYYQTAAHPIDRKYAEVCFQWCGHSVAKQRGPAGYTEYLWIDDWHLDRAWSAAGFGANGYFYTLEDIGKGAEHLEITVWHWAPNTKSPRPLWRRDPVGPSVEIVGDRIYFSTVENLLRYPDLWVAPLATGTGKDARCVFTEPDKRIQVSFMERDGTFFIHKANALEQMLGVLDTEEHIHWIAGPMKSTLVPIGGEWYGTNTHLVHFRTQQRIPLPENEYLVDACRGPAQSLPELKVATLSPLYNSGSSACIESCKALPKGESLSNFQGRSLLVVTTHKGRETLWLCDLKNTWRPILAAPTYMNSILIFHEPTAHPTFLFRSPMISDQVWVYNDHGKLRKILDYPEPLILPYFGSGQVLTLAKAKDVRVPYTWVSAVKKPRALLVEAYGAYGISARRAYPVRWLPYLAAGWAVAYVSPRGGREDGDAWWNGARTALRKANTFQDTAAAIRALQNSLHIPPSATVFFGRSAGGWLAANIAQEHGDLVAAVYAEVPYVDVLRTTTNPTLPLTQLEYDEFGDPTARPAEYRALLKISPVDLARRGLRPQKKSTHPTLIVRTALHDKQVLPYEALKWAAQLRGQAGWDQVFVGIDHDGGHFAAAKSMAQQRAEDAALLEAAVQGTKIPNMVRTKSVKRPRRWSRKRSLRRRGVGISGRTRRLRRRSS